MTKGRADTPVGVGAASVRATEVASIAGGVTCKGVGRVGVPVIGASDGVLGVSAAVCAGLAGEAVEVIGIDGAAVSSGRQADAIRTNRPTNRRAGRRWFFTLNPSSVLKTSGQNVIAIMA
jgi:hypothetical protein